MNNPNFTILIPTRERCQTLRHTLASCVAQDWDDLSIVVSDNHSADDTREVVDAFADPRIRYVNPGRRLSMTGNFEFALSHAGLGYVMHLGDDDGLTPGALSGVAEIIKSTDVLAVTSSSAQYFWPDVHDQSTRNRLTFTTRDGYEIRRTSQVLQDVLSFKRPFHELPGTYSGFVHRSIIDACVSEGKYFHSITPDAYSAIANCSAADTYAFVHAAFAVAGLSGRSNGASHLLRSTSTESELYKRENELHFHEALVFCPSYEVVTAEAFLQAQARLPGLSAHSIDLGALCRAALREAPAWNYAVIAQAVEEIGARNGLRARSAVSKPLDLKVYSNLLRLKRGLGRMRNSYLNVQASDLGAKNINDACRIVELLTMYHQAGYARPFKSLQRWLQRL